MQQAEKLGLTHTHTEQCHPSQAGSTVSAPMSHWWRGPRSVLHKLNVPIGSTSTEGVKKEGINQSTIQDRRTIR